MIDPDPAHRVGLTATIPVEIILAAGLRPVDLNNLFITSEFPDELIRRAEAAGFPHNLCGWIKGIYSSVHHHRLKRVIAVTGGDCSNTVALGEVLESEGIEVIPFRYPSDRKPAPLREEMDSLRERLGTTWPEVEKARRRLAPIRAKLMELDRLTFEADVVSGWENHLFLVSSSDFGSDPDRFGLELDRFIREVKGRAPLTQDVRLGFAGVPPICGDLYAFIESLNARVVYNEVQRQFSMPFESEDVVSQYLRYTYPYAVGARLEDILEAVRARRLDGVIHYTQMFCFRQIQDILLRKGLSVPVLTLEGDRPGPIDGRTATRIETFVEMLREKPSCR